MHSFLSWLQNYLRSNDDDEILNLMTCLLIFNDSVNIDCFFILYFIFIQKKPETQLNDILILLNTVFEETKLPDYSFSLLSLHLSKLLEIKINKNEEIENDIELNKLFELINKILVKKSSQITNQVADEILNPIKSFLIENFDFGVMKIFSTLSQFLSYKAKENIISEFPHKLIQYIEKNSQPCISFHFEQFDEEMLEIKSDNFNTNINLNYLSVSFNKEKTTSQNKLKIITFPMINFESICDKKTIFFICLINESIVAKQEDSSGLFKVFFENFKLLIEKRTYDKFSIMIFGAYLIFCNINEYPKWSHDFTLLNFEYHIWSLEYSIFRHDLNLNEFKTINALRYFSLNLILNHKSAFSSFFNEILKNPVITVEVSERLQDMHFSLFLDVIVADNTILSTLCLATKSFLQDKDEPIKIMKNAYLVIVH